MPLTYEGAGDFQSANPGGKNLHFGIRELQEKFGFEPDRIAAAARDALGRQ